MKNATKKAEKKAVKGDYSYLEQKKKSTTIQTVVYLAIVLMVFFAGLITTKTRNNLMTVVAVVGVLPTAKAAVGMIMYLKVKSIPQTIYETIAGRPYQTAILYNLLISSDEKVIHADCTAIHDNSVLILTLNEKVDEKKLTSYLKKVLSNQGKGNVSVMVFKTEQAFLERLHSIQQVERTERSAAMEQKIASILCSISL